MVEYAQRPAELSGCWGTWAETSVSNVARSTMENGDVKSRRRTTGRFRTADVDVVLPGTTFDAFVDWFEIDCQQGAKPTAMIEPTGVQAVWGFVEPPRYEWLAPQKGRPNAFRVVAKIERRPGWQEI